jgi:hypothetical protein
MLGMGDILKINEWLTARPRGFVNIEWGDKEGNSQSARLDFADGSYAEVLVALMHVLKLPYGALTNGHPKLIINSGDNSIEWKGTRYRVGVGWRRAFQAMLDANGRPVGLSGFLRKGADNLKQLRRKRPELAAIISRADGNKGYYLNVFSTPASA